MSETKLATTYEEVENSRPARRWLYKLSTPIKWTQDYTKSYAEGDERTEFVVVSWGRDGDTCIFPADNEGRLLDTLGFNGRMGWDEPRQRLEEWLGGVVYGLGCGLTFEQVSDARG